MKILFMVAFAVVLVMPGAALAQTGGCEAYFALIEDNLPSMVGDDAALTSLITVTANVWTDNVDPTKIMKSLGEREFSQKGLEKYRVGLMKSSSSKMKYNLERGELRYVNQDRRFDSAKPGKAIDPSKGLEMARKLLSGNIGVPRSEILGKNTLSQVLQGGIARPGTQDLVKRYDIESHFFFQRAINGIPVMNSGAFVAVSNKGQISQFQVRWPVMRVDQSLLKAGVLSQKEVINNIYNRLVQDQPCDQTTSIKKLNMFIAYVPSVVTNPDKDKIPEPARRVRYTPKLIVYFLPDADGEAGEVLEFDLFNKDGRPES
ncbi:MAG TPA: hypothetical protein PLM79_02710 [Syntrophobacteraceae bacterium]|nr:hypothetical protein [Syntrophobacteraceae bacterium]